MSFADEETCGFFLRPAREFFPGLVAVDLALLFLFCPDIVSERKNQNNAVSKIILL
jgi:hypothetical protein